MRLGSTRGLSAEWSPVGDWSGVGGETFKAVLLGPSPKPPSFPAGQRTVNF